MKPTIIGIAGGTASGKTTIAKKLYEEACKAGSVVLIRIDDYYYGLINVPKSEDGRPNFDHPDAYDVDLIIQNLNDLINYKAIEKPTYDFVHSQRTNTTEHINPADVIIVEGIMTFAIEKLRKYFDIKIFVDTPDDIRFIRRLKRDIEERGRDLDSVINQYLFTVKPMFNKFVNPSSRYADIIIPNDNKHDVAVDFLVAKIKDILNTND